MPAVTLYVYPHDDCAAAGGARAAAHSSSISSTSLKKDGRRSGHVVLLSPAALLGCPVGFCPRLRTTMTACGACLFFFVVVVGVVVAQCTQ
jgi:hypothetical protein